MQWYQIDFHEKKESYSVRRDFEIGCCGGGLKTGSWVIAKLTNPKTIV